MRTAPQDSPGTEVRFREYLLQNVYLRTTQDQRAEVMTLWQEEGALDNPVEAERRSHEAVFLVRAASGELAGLSTVGLVRSNDGRLFYAYRMFLRKRNRVPNLMLAVIAATRDFLTTFRHPTSHPAGMVHVNENPKLMRPGARRAFERLGYRFWGTTSEAEEVWVFEFGPPTGTSAQPARWRKVLTQLTAFLRRHQESHLEFAPISEVPKPT